MKCRYCPVEFTPRTCRQVTCGGGGCKRKYRATPERKAKERELAATPAMKAKKRAYRTTPERKAKERELAATPEAKAYQRKYRATPEAKAKAREYRATPAMKAKKRARSAKYYATPEVKVKMKILRKAYRATPEAKAYQRKYRATPERKAKAREYNATPARKAKERELAATSEVVPRPASAKWVEIKADADGRAWIDAGDKAGEWELIDRTGAYLEVIPGAKYPSFAASRPGLYRVIGVADGKLVRVIIQVGDVPVPPGPGPVIPPDAFVAKLQTAFVADLGPTKAVDLNQLKALYAEAVAFADKAEFATASDLFAAVSAAAVALLPPDANGQRKLAAVRTIIGMDLASVLPTDPDAPLTEAVRKAAGAAFARYAAALAKVMP